MNETPAPYKGEVLFIVHAPAGKSVYPDTFWQRLKTQNRAEIVKALSEAENKKSPVFYLRADEGQQDTMIELLAKATHKPKIIEIKYLSPYHIKKYFSEHGITPTRAVFYGQLRDECVKNSAKIVRKAFPHLSIIIPEGTKTIFYARKQANKARQKYRKEFAKHKFVTKLKKR